MGNNARIVISASRRTDIPAFYMPWFMRKVQKGVVQVVNPYNRHAKEVSLSPTHVHSIVFWSKNLTPFIAGEYDVRLLDIGHRLYFNFSLNSESKALEPQIPPLTDRIRQLKRICEIHGPETITWRFDPICFYQSAMDFRDNLADFKRIARVVADMGIHRCITSFRDDYRKVQLRTARITGFRFRDPSLEEKSNLLLQMGAFLDSLDIRLYTCCEQEVLESLPSDSGIESAACIDHRLLGSLFGEDLTLQKDTGQRTQLGCGCYRSVDIGDYRQHPCYHNCLYCYANPTHPPHRDEPSQDELNSDNATGNLNGGPCR